MVVATSDDISYMLSVNDFGLEVGYQEAAAGNFTVLRSIFDNETVPMDAGGTAQIHQDQPRLTVLTNDLPNLSVADVIRIGTTLYNVVAFLHDGTGVTTIQLEKQ